MLLRNDVPPRNGQWYVIERVFFNSAPDRFSFNRCPLDVERLAVVWREGCWYGIGLDNFRRYPRCDSVLSASVNSFRVGYPHRLLFFSCRVPDRHDTRDIYHGSEILRKLTS